MGVFDKLKKAVSIKDDDYDDDEFYDDDDELEEDDDLEEDSKKKKGLFGGIFGRKKNDSMDDFDDEDDAVSRPREGAAPAASARKRTRVTSEIKVEKPASMEDCGDIADVLLSGSSVILNLEGMDVEVAQRVVDFTSGACYSIGGKLHKITSYIFLLSPASVGVSGDILQQVIGSAED